MIDRFSLAGNFALDTVFRPFAKRLQADHMSALGIANTMRLAHTYNRLKFGWEDNRRRWLYREKLQELIEENGPLSRPLTQLQDGWAIDTSMSLPHLQRVLEDAERIIDERSGIRRSNEGAYRSYFQDMWMTPDLERYPSFLDFATSSDLLATVADYLKCVPALSTTAPSGIRFVESNAAFDDQPISRTTASFIISTTIRYLMSTCLSCCGTHHASTVHGPSSQKACRKKLRAR